MIVPDWPAAARVHAVMTTRNTQLEELHAVLPRDPVWLLSLIHI